MARRRRPPIVPLLALLLGAAGARCGGGSSGPVALQAPAQQLIVQEGQVDVRGEVGAIVDPGSVALSLDGVDLIAALGLVPPFTAAGGTVQVGADLVVVSDLTYEPSSGTRVPISAHVEGLPLGAHQVELSGVRNTDSSVAARTRSFEAAAPLVEVLHAAPSVGLRAPESAGPGLSLANAAFGEALAAPPQTLSDGSSLRSGFVETVEARLAGGSPP